MPNNVFKFLYKTKKDVSPILKLSHEFRAPIWTFVSSSDKKNLRLVCKALKNDIDTKFGVPINLDERKFQILNVLTTLPPSASKLRIWGSQFTQSFVNRLLINSRLVTSVSFSGPTDLTNFSKVLTRCPNLISVTVTDRSEIEDILKISLKLRNILVLQLGTEGGLSDYDPDITPNLPPWSTYDDILNHLVLPCLRILTIEFTTSDHSPPFSQIITSILNYLIAHKTVKDLTLRLHKGLCHLNKSCKEGELEVEFTTGQLKPIKLHKLILDLHEDVFTISDILLPNQDSLEYFDYWNEKRDWDYFNQIIKRNISTLKTVKIRKLKPTSELRIDLGVFEKCTKLKELLLTRFGNATKEVCFRVTQSPNELPFLDKISSRTPELITLKSLPSSLKKLCIQGFTVKTEDLSWISIKLKDLRFLELQMLGYHGPGDFEDGTRDVYASSFPRDISRHGLGVTPAILKEIFTKLRKLDTVFVEEFYNNRTILKDLEFQNAVKQMNLIPGESLMKVQGYFGIMINAKVPSALRRIPRAQRNDFWDIRFNQYLYQKWITEKLNGK